MAHAHHVSLDDRVRFKKFLRVYAAQLLDGVLHILVLLGPPDVSVSFTAKNMLVQQEL
jgi:hypothetical protein